MNKIGWDDYNKALLAGKIPSEKLSAWEVDYNRVGGIKEGIKQAKKTLTSLSETIDGLMKDLKDDVKESDLLAANEKFKEFKKKSEKAIKDMVWLSTFKKA